MAGKDDDFRTAIEKELQRITETAKTCADVLSAHHDNLVQQMNREALSLRSMNELQPQLERMENDTKVNAVFRNNSLKFFSSIDARLTAIEAGLSQKGRKFFGIF